MQVVSNRSLAKKKSLNPILSDYELISIRQINLVFKIREYRDKHALSQPQFAEIASIYGKPLKTKITYNDIYKYESFHAVPGLKKMCVLLKTLGIEVEELDRM